MLFVKQPATLGLTASYSTPDTDTDLSDICHTKFNLIYGLIDKILKIIIMCRAAKWHIASWG